MDTILHHINDHKNDSIYTLFISTLSNNTLSNNTLSNINTPLSVDDTTILAQHLCAQLNILEYEYSKSIAFIRLSDITVLNNTIFIISNLENMVNLHTNNTDIVLICPSTKFNHKTCSPELLSINILPFITHKSSSYYSIGLLCLTVLNMRLDEIKNTRLFYFLVRCLNKILHLRKCIFI